MTNIIDWTKQPSTIGKFIGDRKVCNNGMNIASTKDSEAERMRKVWERK